MPYSAISDGEFPAVFGRDHLGCECTRKLQNKFGVGLSGAKWCGGAGLRPHRLLDIVMFCAESLAAYPQLWVGKWLFVV